MSSPSASFIVPRHRWLAIGMVAVLVAVGIQYGGKVGRDPSRSAILRWTQALQELWQGADIYQQFSYPNPPIMAMLLSPLAQIGAFSPLAEALLWFYLKAAMLLISLYWVFRIVQGSDAPFPPWSKELVVLLSLWPLMGDLTHANINLFIFFLIMAGLYLFYSERPFLCGVLLALATACKVTPALFLPYFVWKRSWKAVGGMGAGLALFLWFIPAISLGAERNTELFGSWWKQMVAPYLSGTVAYSENPNQSLPGLAVRLLTHSPSFSSFSGDEKVNLRFDNWLDLSTGQVAWIIKGAMVMFSLAVMAACRTSIRQPHNWRMAAEYAVVLLGMLLFSERTWKHHCVTLILPFAVVVYALANLPLSRLMRVYLMACLGACAVFMASASISPLDHFHGLSKMAHVYGVYVWSYLILLVCILVMLRTPALKSA